jgi:hypothetical protein
MATHPEKKGDRNPLTSRKLRENLLKNRFVPKKKQEKSVAEPAPTPGPVNPVPSDTVSP